jgi:hypothetical protein
MEKGGTSIGMITAYTEISDTPTSKLATTHPQTWYFSSGGLSVISRAVWLTLFLPLLCEGVAPCKAPAPTIVTIRSAPERPIVEVRDGNQFLNFDMMVRSVSGFTLRISQIELSVYDSAHQLVLRRSINTDAFAPALP